MKPSPFAKRNADIVAQRKAGQTLKQIAEAHGLSQGRVREIIYRIEEYLPHKHLAEEQRQDECMQALMPHLYKNLKAIKAIAEQA